MKNPIHILKHFCNPKSFSIFFNSFLNQNKYITNDSAINSAIAWLLNIRNKGFPAKYSILHGMGNDFPETTGYIIPTLIKYNKPACIKAGDWLIEIQNEDGSFGTDNNLQDKKIFDTSQTIFGLLSLYKETSDRKYLDSAYLAADFIVKNQEPNGSFIKYAYNNIPHSYYTRTAYALLLLDKDKYQKSAERNIRWTISNQQENGFFSHSSFNKNESSPLHTIAYTIEGILKSGIILNNQNYISVAKKSADMFLNKELYSFYDSKWNIKDSSKCLTGMAQISIIFLNLYEITKDIKYLLNAKKINRYLKKKQIHSKYKLIDGAIPGSYPINAKYMPFSYPNWSAKFFIDSLVLENKYTEDYLSIAIYTNDPIENYLKKGELRKNYWNPDNLFKKIYVINNSNYNFSKEEIEKISFMVGEAKLKIIPIKDAKEINNVDFIRTYGLYQPGLLASILSKKYNIPFIISLHTNYDDYRNQVLTDRQYFKYIKQIIWKYLFELRILKSADKILAVYEFAALYPEKHGIEDIEIIYNRIDPKIFYREPDRNKDFTIINVNNLIPGKNQRMLIKAIKNTSCNLILIGQGPERQNLINLIKKLNLQSQVQMISKVPNKELVKYYNKAHIYASVNYYGGIGIGAIEAIACGLPVIHTKHEWEKEPNLLKMDNCLFTKTNTEAVKESILKLKNNEELYKELEEKSTELFKKNSGVIMSQKEKEFYIKVL